MGAKYRAGGLDDPEDDGGDIAAGEAAQDLPKPYHENIADMLFEKFGGSQRLRAFHHGVEIETVRG